MTRHSASARHAFTLVELLAAFTAAGAVLAAAAVFAQPVLPAVESRTASCRNNLREMLIGLGLFANDHKNTIPGPNTTGAVGQTNGGSTLVGNRTSATPVSTHDWISPMLGSGLGLPVNRAARTQQILDRLACPYARSFNNAVFGQAPDLGDFLAIASTTRFRQVSYLSPSSFHYYPNSTVAAANPFQGFTLKSSATTPVAINSAYRPRIDMVGAQASNKVFLADGTRFVSGGSLDIDITPSPSVNGAFLDNGPILHQSAAYGRAAAGAPTNVTLSFRHPGNVINAGMFDGSVRKFTNTQAWTDATPWYPGGSVYNGTNATPESAAFHNTPASRNLQ